MEILEYISHKNPHLTFDNFYPWTLDPILTKKPVTLVIGSILPNLFPYSVETNLSIKTRIGVANYRIEPWMEWAKVRKPSIWTAYPKIRTPIGEFIMMVGFTDKEDAFEFGLKFS